MLLVCNPVGPNFFVFLKQSMLFKRITVLLAISFSNAAVIKTEGTCETQLTAADCERYFSESGYTWVGNSITLPFLPSGCIVESPYAGFNSHDTTAVCGQLNPEPGTTGEPVNCVCDDSSVAD